eukprot:tig00021348_g20548.t1
MNDLLLYVPRLLLAEACEQMGALRAGVLEAGGVLKEFHGAAIFVDVTGFSKLGVELSKLSRSGSEAAERLTSVLNGYFRLLVACLHRRGASVLFFGGDSIMAFIPEDVGAGRSLADAAACALHAALDIRAIPFSAHGISLAAHTGLGVGRLEMHLLQAGPQAASVLFGGRALLEASGPPPRPSHTPLPLPPRQPPGAGRAGLPAEQRAGRRATGALRVRGAGARGEASAAALLGTFSRELRAIAAGGSPGGGLFEGDMRGIFALFCAFPELDDLEEPDPARLALARPPGPPPPPLLNADARLARSCGPCTAPHDKGCVALVAFGVRAHEDDAARAVRAALDLRAWFEEDGAPFAAAIASGRAFVGPLGAPCRKEWALISEAVTLASRLLSAARAAIGAASPASFELGAPARAPGPGPGPGGGGAPARQEVLCTEAVAAAVRARGRSGLRFEALPDIAAKGFEQPVPVRRPRPCAADEGGTTRRRRRRPPDPAPPPPAGPPSPRPRPGPESPRAPLPPPTARSMRNTRFAALVGREAELAAGREAIEALVAEGRGRTLAVEGDAGYGKTRLMRELQRLCAARASASSPPPPPPARRGGPSPPSRASSPRSCRGRLGRRRGAGGGALPPPPRGAPGRGAPRLRPPPAHPRRLLCSRSAAWEDGFEWASPASSGSRPGPRRRSQAAAAFALVGLSRVARIADALARLLEAPVAESDGAEVPGASAPAPPTALFVEDVHWADSASWFALRCLRDACPRLLLVLSSRPMASPPREFLIITGQASDAAGEILAAGGAGAGDVAWPRPASARLPRLRPAAGASLLRLGPSRATPPPPSSPCVPARAPAQPRAPQADREREAGAGGAARGGAEWPEAVLDAIVERAEGVPLSLVELFRQQAAGGAQPKVGSSSDIPDTIERIILARADALPAEVRSVAKVAAVLGAGFTAEAAHACDPAGPPLAAVLAAFDALRRERILAVSSLVSIPDRDAAQNDRDRESGPESESEEREARAPHSFVHAMQREALYHSIPLAQRRDVHARAAAWLEGASEHPEPAAVALHWDAAGDLQRALPALERAAEAARAGGALHESRRTSARIAARWRVARALALANWAHVDFVSGRRRAARDVAMIALETLGTPLRTRPPTLLNNLRLALTLLRSATALRRAKWRAGAGAGAESEAGREHRAAVMSLYVIWRSALTGESRPGELPGPVVAVAAAVQGVQRALAAPQEVFTYHDVRALSAVPLLLTMLGIGSEERADAAQASVHALADTLHHNAALAADMTCLGARLAQVGKWDASVAAYARGVSLLGRMGDPTAGLFSLDLAFTRLLTGRLGEAHRAAEEALVFASRMAAGATEYVVTLAAVMCATVALWRGDAATAASVLTTMKLVEEGAAAVEGRSWAQQVSGFGRAVLALRGGDEDAMWRFARSTLALWRVEGQSWHHIFLLWSVVDYVQYQAFLARQHPRHSAATTGGGGGGGGVLRALRCWRPRRSRVAAEVINARAELDRKGPPPLALGDRESAGSASALLLSGPGSLQLSPAAPGAGSARESLSEPRPAAALREDEEPEALALACLRLALAEPAAAAAAEAHAAAARIALETGLEMPVPVPLPKAAGEAGRPPGEAFVSLWPWGGHSQG